MAMTLIKAYGQESTLGIHTVSYHNGGNYNDITPGLYFERNNYVVGAYHNSIRNTSFYGGYTWTWPLPPNPIVNRSLIHRWIGDWLSAQRLQQRYCAIGCHQSSTRFRQSASLAFVHFAFA
jgi:hypothetical protein